MYYKSADLPRDISPRLWPAVISPRPVLLIVTVSESGVPNIAAFSSVAIVSLHPPIVSLSFGLRNGRIKHTLRNILDNGKFTLNVVTKDLAEAANLSAEGSTVQDDFVRLGLTRILFEESNVPGIHESPASIACQLSQNIAIEGSRGTLILARCNEVIFSDALSVDGVLDPFEANVIASIGVEEYISVKGETFSLPRLWE